MARLGSVCILYLVLVLVLFKASSSVADQERKLHIVYMGALSQSEEYSPYNHHLGILESVVDASSLNQSWVRSYKRSFNGFAAYLTDDERQQINSLEEVVSVFPSQNFKPQTTRSWDYMGFNENIVVEETISKSDVIVGLIDTGIWPESDSFSDQGFGPIPTRWKGQCQGGLNFTCNKKIIGARYYTTSSTTENSARDTVGHGSHTASIAAGNTVPDASFYGYGKGTARGGLPSARIAVYKVCYAASGCSFADILAAFDDAIADGVDIISTSMGGKLAINMDTDPVSIGSFHAMERGILTVQAAGNYGPEPGTIVSVAPWILSVAASTIDRRFADEIILGDGTSLIGGAVNTFNLNQSNIPLIYGKAAAESNCSEFDAEQCYSGCLNPELVKGKIVICNHSVASGVVHAMGAVGLITTESGPGIKSSVVSIPASVLDTQSFLLLRSYINSTQTPVASISQSESVQDLRAPVVASFSSKGPNPIIPDLLKPDVSAPGVQILGAFSPVAFPTNDPLDKRSVKYNIMSGTSMACPHASGAAAYLKSLYPNWRTSAIKSALMTTAFQMNPNLNEEAEFAYGNGHILPQKAADPGLLYEAYKEDYIQMLCNMNYDVTRLRKISGDNTTSCQKTNYSTKDLNYPSMTAQIQTPRNYNVTFLRTVTNVGNASSTYRATITKNYPFNVSVNPTSLSFGSLYEKKSFVVVISGNELKSTATASLVWSDGSHSVRSPIVLYTYTSVV